MHGTGAWVPTAVPEVPPGWKPSWNVAPRAVLPALVAEDGRASCRFLRWGLVPRWADDPAIGDRLVNARAETVAEKPSFRDAWRRRRCLVPVVAFYEWKRVGNRREPWAFGPAAGDEPFLWLGGLHETWKAPDGSERASFAIVTTAANGTVAPVHDRMPVTLAAGDRPRWLGIEASAGDEPPADLLGPAVESAMRRWRVSTAVNDARRDGPECLDPVPDGSMTDPPDTLFGERA